MTDRPEKNCFFGRSYMLFFTFQLILILLMHIEYHFCKTINLARTLLSWGVFNHYLPKLKTTRNYQFSWVWLLFDMIQKPHPSVDTNATGCMKAISFVSRNGKLIQRAFSMSLPCVITLLTRWPVRFQHSAHTFSRECVWEGILSERMQWPRKLCYNDCSEKCLVMGGQERSSQLRN